MKKLISLFLSFILIFTLTGCGNGDNLIRKINNVTDKQMTLNFAFGDRTGKYTGEVNEQGLPDGKGKFSSQNPNGYLWTYEGDFKNGHFDGQGTATWTGQKDVGEFKNDLMNGNGKRFINENLVYDGHFENNNPMLESVGLNTEVSFADWTYKVTNFEFVNTIRNEQAHGQFLIVEINATNNGHEMRKIGENNFFVVIDGLGRVYQASNNAMLAKQISNPNNSWFLSDINPGLSEQNIPFIFDVPKDIQGIKFLPRNGFGKVSPIKLQ